MGVIPKPGQRVRGSRTGAPIMALFDLLGRRWSMGVLWNLCMLGPATFRDLQARCQTISPAVLNQRLKELRAAGFVEKTERGYSATELGLRLYGHLVPFRHLATDWAAMLGDSSASSES